MGAVLGHFIAKKHVPKYSEHLKAGNYLVGSDYPAQRLAVWVGRGPQVSRSREDRVLGSASGG